LRSYNWIEIGPLEQKDCCDSAITALRYESGD
jgi:hypothetical protein